MLFRLKCNDNTVRFSIELSQLVDNILLNVTPSGSGTLTIPRGGPSLAEVAELFKGDGRVKYATIRDADSLVITTKNYNDMHPVTKMHAPADPQGAPMT